MPLRTSDFTKATPLGAQLIFPCNFKRVFLLIFKVVAPNTNGIDLIHILYYSKIIFTIILFYN